MKIKTKLSAGVDLTATSFEYIGENLLKIGTGFKQKKCLPLGLYMQLHLRSSINARGYSSGVGVIDADYLGEVFVICRTPNNLLHDLKAGERIAQLIVMEHQTHKYFETENVVRSGGIGSTGG